MQLSDDSSEAFASAKVVVMCGVSGSGKTYLSRRLEQEGFVRISSDELIWQLYGGAGFLDLPMEERMRIFQRIDGEMMGELERRLDAGERVVVDATFCKRFKRDAIRERLAARGIEPTLVYLNAPFALLRERLAAREGTGPNDQIIPEPQLATFCSHFEPPAPDEPHLEITFAAGNK